MSDREQGATLPELLTVISILGVISTIATPIALSNIEKAKQSVDSYNEATIQSAVERFMTNYPDASITAGILNTSGATAAKVNLGSSEFDLATLLVHGITSQEGPLLEAIPLDSNQRAYAIVQNRQHIVITAP